MPQDYDSPASMASAYIRPGSLDDEEYNAALLVADVDISDIARWDTNFHADGSVESVQRPGYADAVRQRQWDAWVVVPHCRR